MSVILLPDIEAICVDWLLNHPDVSAITTNIYTENPEAVEYPFLTLLRIAGRPEVRPRWIDHAHLQIAAWGDDSALSRENTRDLCETATAALHELNGTTTLGVVTAVEDILGPRSLPDPETSFPRFIAEVLVTAHPGTEGSANSLKGGSVMAQDATEVVVGANGDVYVAPVGTSLPLDVDDPLNAAFSEALGFTSEDGVTATDGKTTENIGAWQSFYPLRTLVTERNFTVAFVLRQWNQDTVSLAFGGGTFTAVGSHTTYTPPDPAVHRRAGARRGLAGRRRPVPPRRSSLHRVRGRRDPDRPGRQRQTSRSP